jgi:hypothetical protein
MAERNLSVAMSQSGSCENIPQLIQATDRSNRAAFWDSIRHRGEHDIHFASPEIELSLHGSVFSTSCLVLGSALRAGTESSLPSGTSDDESIVARR